MPTALAKIVSNLEKILLAKNCHKYLLQILVRYSKNNSRNLFKAFLYHFLTTIKGRGSIS